MGNIFSIQCGDALSGRCWDCISEKSQYISQLEANLVSLETARDQLSELKNDVMRSVINQQTPQMEQPDQVTGWLSTVDRTVAQVTVLLAKGDQERQKLCMSGCCSYNCISTYKFGKSVAQSLDRVNALMAEADFNQVVVEAPQKKLESLLQDLADAKEGLEALKEDLQRRISSEEGPEKQVLKQVQVWLSKVETAQAKANKLLNDGPRELTKLLSGDNSNSIFVGVVAQHIGDICSLQSQGDFSQVTAKALQRRVVERNQRPTVGTKKMLEEAWSLLREDEVGVLGIYGMGGVGKTTLLKQINNKFSSNPNDFDVVIWVVVSKDLKLDNIQASIWKQIRSMDDRWLQKSFEEKAQDIFDVLQRKKFALLLDDVWQQFDLQDIGVPLPIQQNGSKVVLTTRSLAVCNEMEATKTMKVKPLNHEEAWKLFKEKVGKIDTDVLHVAQTVAEECQGLPIALITIGRAMVSRSTYEEWEHALKVLRRSVSECMENELYLGMEVHVFQRLKFSYDSLSNNKVQNCFVYCSLFPEDFEIPMDDLVGYWVAEKFCERGEGRWIVRTLVQQCLLEVGKSDSEHVKMHDVIRDMALWIACKCEKEKHMFFVKAGAHLTRLPGVEEWEGAKRVSFMANSFTSIEGNPKCSDLLTLFLSRNKELKMIPKGFFRSMTRLTLLDLSWSKLEVLPLEITNLQSLEFLNLSYSMLIELPTETKNLIRLKYLNIESTFIMIIPVEVISSLMKLKVLNMFNLPNLPYYEVGNNVLSKDGKKLMKELMCLKNLSELSLVVRSASFLQSICSNQHLLNSVRALHLKFIVDSKPFNILSLANAEQLLSLHLEGAVCWEEKVIEEKETHTHGWSSSLITYTWKHIPIPIFCGLREVHVIACHNMQHMTWLIFAPNLTILVAWENENMKQVISAEKLSEYQAMGQHLNLFPKLQLLHLAVLPKLKTICPEALSFPCLKHIIVINCPALTKLPLNSKSAEGCDVVIKGEESWWNELTWEDDETRAAFSPCFQKQ